MIPPYPNSDISRYVCRAARAGGVWTFTQLLNTTQATITPTRSGDNFLLTANTPVWSTTKTYVVTPASKLAGIQILLASVTTTVVTITYAQNNDGDVLYLDVYTINI